MKPKLSTILSNLKNYLGRALCGLVVMLSIWQGISIGIDPAIAAPSIDLKVPESMGNQKEIVIKKLEQREAKAEKRVETAMKDGNKSMKKSLDKAKDAMENTAEKVEKSAKDNTKKAKNFFGF
jgi:ribosome recycling factor